MQMHAEHPDQGLYATALQASEHARARTRSRREDADWKPAADPLHVALETPSVEEQTRIWHSLQESYQLSVTYRVQLVSIEAAHEPVRSSPVLVRQAGYRQVLAVK